MSGRPPASSSLLQAFYLGAHRRLRHRRRRGDAGASRPLIPVAALIPVHGLIQLGSNTGRAWHQRVHIMRTIAAQWLPFVGLMIGAG